MELLRLIDSRIGRWLAYADSCMNADGELARCQPFWIGVVAVLGIICIVALVSVVVRIFLDRRKRAAAQAGADGRNQKRY